MSQSERREMIRKVNTKLSLTRQCKLLKISRSSLYYTPVGVNAETLKLMHEIDRGFTKYPFIGSRQIAAYLPQSEFSAGRHRVRRLMGITGPHQQRHLRRHTERPSLCGRQGGALSHSCLWLPPCEASSISRAQ
jgi:hypothetical protein